MTKLERSFEIEGRADLEVVIAAGKVSVAEAAGGTVDVVVAGSDRALETIEIEQLGRTVVVRQRASGRLPFTPSTDVTVEMPAGGRVSIKTASGDVRVSVPLDELFVKVAASDVRVGIVHGSCTVKSASGGVALERAGDAQLASASGDIRVDRVDTDLAATTASGDITVGSFGRTAILKTASGEIVVDRFEAADLDTKSMSGSIRVGLPPGLEVDADLQSLSGSIRNELGEPSGPRFGRAHLRAKTLSGDIVLRSVAAG